MPFLLLLFSFAAANAATGSGVLANSTGNDPARNNSADADFDEFHSHHQILSADRAATYFAVTNPVPTRASGGGDVQSSGSGSVASVATFFNGNSSDCVTGGPVYLTNVTVTLGTNQGPTVSFQIEGGQTNTIYDILVATNLSTNAAQWTWLGQGHTCCSYSFLNQPNARAYYAVAAAPGSCVLAWGADDFHQADVPSGLTNAVQLAGGEVFSVALKADGTVIAWGTDNQQQTNVPAGLANVVAIAANAYHTLALRADGTVTNWGKWWDGNSNYYGMFIPSTLSNVVSVAAGMDHDLALLADGTVTNWGYTNQSWNSVPSGLRGVTAIACGYQHDLVLLNDGTVRTWGFNGGVFGWNVTNVPAGLNNVVAIAAGENHSLALKSDGTVVAWGAGNSSTLSNTFGNFNQSVVPTGLSNAVAISAGGYHSLALQSDGTVVPWGDLGPVFSAPYIATNYVAIGSGAHDEFAIFPESAALGLLTPPSLATASPSLGNLWVQNGNMAILSVTTAYAAQFYYPDTYQWQFNGTNIPGATNEDYVVAITPGAPLALEGTYSIIASNAAGATNLGSWAVKYATAGGVATFGANNSGQANQPTTLTNVMGLAAGLKHAVAALDDGTVVAWGDNNFNETNVPSGLSNVVAVAAGSYFTLALKSDGTVVGWGQDTTGQTDPPLGLSNIIAIAAGGNQSLALSNNGTVTTWGGTYGTVPAGLSNVIAIAGGGEFALALQSNGMVRAWGDGNALAATNVPLGLSNVVAIAAGAAHALALKADGTVAAWGANFVGQANVPQGLSNVMAIAAGSDHSLALKNDGTVVAWGYNANGQTNSTGLSGIKLIAAGGNLSLASVFSPLVGYSVNAANDLLLIYNTNSADSSNVMSYYLANRPGVSGANVLGIGYTNSGANYTNYYETIDTTDFTNRIAMPIQNWLGNNPTKRPGYVILFLDVPSRVNDCTVAPPAPYYPSQSNYPSVAMQINSSLSTTWQPFVTSINMNGTNDCIGYINKIISFGSNSPGKLVISDSTGKYADVNYVLDNVRYGGLSNILGDYTDYGYVVASATNGLLANGAAANDTIFADGLELFTNGIMLALPHLTGVSSLAGYMCWGVHSSLGASYATNGDVRWNEGASWYLMATCESHNGERYSDQGNFLQWFSAGAFGGANYSNTPVGAVTYVCEPTLAGINDAGTYFGLWAGGKNFANCAWNSRQTLYFQAVGDPFVKR